ncbi:hypothetical protein J2Z66_008730 [Paenibacillus eucommiae]|uniref:Uncharacterized protein n=1 Tax=Paenibacillus eucommiae TaxID=1355755 RepID=A0ABS4JB31_9BACL|nr:hypothetical protein [Paenibacillus eucommiae]
MRVWVITQSQKNHMVRPYDQFYNQEGLRICLKSGGVTFLQVY